MEVMEEVCCPAKRSAISSPTIWSSVLEVPSLYFMSTNTCAEIHSNYGSNKMHQTFASDQDDRKSLTKLLPHVACVHQSSSSFVFLAFALRFGQVACCTHLRCFVTKTLHVCTSKCNYRN